MAKTVPLPSMASSFNNTIIFMVVAVVFLVPTSDAQLQPIIQNCNDNNDNYTINSTYYANLNLLTSSLSLNGSVNGYAEGTVGTVPDRVYGLVLCRGDITSTKCKTCLDAARQDVLDKCPLKKAVTIWYEYCLLRYSNQRFAGTIGQGQVWYPWSPQNITSIEWPRFNQSLMEMVGTLIQYVTYNKSALPPLMFATGEIKLEGEFPVIYGLVQCTRDLPPDVCNQCLQARIGDLNNCCHLKGGGTVLAPSCNLRYEVYNFYSGKTRVYLQAVGDMSPAPAPFLLISPTSQPGTNSTNTTANGNKKTTTGIILAVAIPTGAAFILLLLCLGCCLSKTIAKKRSINRNYHPIASVESLLFDLETLRTATSCFSEANKLGEGGFGVVYKGNIKDGQEIAVKRLSESSSQGLNELKNEVFLLAKLQHRNLVKLLGVCLEEEEKLLIYE